MSCSLAARQFAAASGARGRIHERSARKRASKRCERGAHEGECAVVDGDDLGIAVDHHRLVEVHGRPDRSDNDGRKERPEESVANRLLAWRMQNTVVARGLAGKALGGNERHERSEAAARGHGA